MYRHNPFQYIQIIIATSGWHFYVAMGIIFTGFPAGWCLIWYMP